jgi:hypothetical protein
MCFVIKRVKEKGVKKRDFDQSQKEEEYKKKGLKRKISVNPFSFWIYFPFPLFPEN